MTSAPVVGVGSKTLNGFSSIDGDAMSHQSFQILFISYMILMICYLRIESSYYVSRQVTKAQRIRLRLPHLGRRFGPHSSRTPMLYFVSSENKNVSLCNWLIRYIIAFKLILKYDKCCLGRMMGLAKAFKNCYLMSWPQKLH